MKKNARILNALLMLCVSAIVFSCNNGTDTTKEETKKTDSVVAEAPPPAAPVFNPFKVMLIKHTVADFDKWKPVYTGHDSARKAYGLSDLALLRGIDNPSRVLVVEKFTDLQKAKDFTMLPNLKEAMEKGGVKGKPEFSYYDVLRDDDAKIDTKDRIMVTHKVKDFDAWVKVYDGEGKEARAAEGMVDRVLSRGIDDPNLVQLVFAVTDMAKAKAAITSDAKKKLMTSAGVEGVPVIEFYREAE